MKDSLLRPEGCATKAVGARCTTQSAARSYGKEKECRTEEVSTLQARFVDALMSSVRASSGYHKAGETSVLYRDDHWESHCLLEDPRSGGQHRQAFSKSY